MNITIEFHSSLRNTYSCSQVKWSHWHTLLLSDPCWSMPLQHGIHTAYGAKDINKLDMVQRRAARFVKRDYRNVRQ